LGTAKITEFFIRFAQINNHNLFEGDMIRLINDVLSILIRSLN